MTRFFYVCTVCLFGLYGQVMAQDMPAAQEVLNKALKYHDSQGDWYKVNHTIKLLSKRPSGADRHTTIALNHLDGSFGMAMQRDGMDIKTSLKDGDCEATVDGSTTFTEEQAETYRLHCDGITRWRHYHGYMLGLPMKLNDAGTILDPEVRHEQFMGNDVLALKVTYEASVGADTWYFYLDPANYALVGTRFYHDESKNDGEYIILEGEVAFEGIRLPKTRKWYYNNNDEFLGEDEILEFTYQK